MMMKGFFSKSRTVRVSWNRWNFPRRLQHTGRSAVDEEARTKLAHGFRLGLETSWLNWTRNAMISSVSGVALYTGSKVDKREDLWASKLFLGAGLLFMSSGTAQYLISLLAFETSPSILAWSSANAVGILAMYSSGVYYFMEHCEDRLEADMKQQETKVQTMLETGFEDQGIEEMRTGWNPFRRDSTKR